MNRQYSSENVYCHSHAHRISENPKNIPGFSCGRDSGEKKMRECFAAFVVDGVCAHVFLDIGAIGVDRPLVCTTETM